MNINFKKELNLIITLIIIIFFIDIYILSNNIFFSFIKEINDIKKVTKYIQFFNNYKYSELKNFIKKKNPKISVISPVFNRERYLFRFLRSIQHQNFKDIEIIFVDDCSKDNSIKKIEEFQKKDKRLILIKNKKIKELL